MASQNSNSNSNTTGSNDAKRRVKLYALNASKQWDDKGTGHVTSCYHEPLDGMSLLVRNESDGSLLLESKIQLDTLYQKQQGTLIVWTESDNYDLALSFQEQDGCNEIWEKICQVQGRDPYYDNQQDDDDQQEDIKINLIDCDQEKLQLILEQINAYSQTTRRRDVLATEYIENNYISKLINIFKIVDDKQDINILHKLYEIFKQLFLYDRPTLTEVMLNEQYLMDVIGVFEYEPPPQKSQEDEELDQEQIKSTQPDSGSEQQQQQQPDQYDDDVVEQENKIKIDEDTISEQMELTDEKDKEKDESQVPISIDEIDSSTSNNFNNNNNNNLNDIDNANDNQQQPMKSQKLESNTTTRTPKQIIPRKRHREFLLNGTTFKEVIPFSNQKLVEKIHQTYRVQYLQTSVLPSPSILEENAYASLTNILFFNKVEIVSMIQENEEFQKDLFNQIISNETGLEKKRELILFLREYCIFSQTIPPKQRDSFFKTLASLKILSAVEVALSSNDQVIKSAAIDIFTYLVEYNPHMTREHAVQQKEGIIDPPNSNAQTANILKLVIEHITTDQDPELGTATQLACIIRLLLDPENMPGDDLGKHSFLDFFYFTCMQSLVEPIKKSTTSDGNIEPSANDRKTAQLLSIMLELVTFFMEHHYNQLRNYILSSDLLRRITSLIKSRHKFLVLSVVRFFRRLVATKDEVYFDLIMREELFNPIIQVLKNNNGRYNLLDSAILEMFEFIQKSIDYVNTFKAMRQKREDYDSMRDNAMKTNRSSIENSQMYFGNHSRRDMENIWLESENDDVHDIGETESDKDLDPDSGDANVDSEPDGLNLPELEFTMNGSRNDEDEDVEPDDEVEAEAEEDDIQMDEEDCEDELEPQFKRKKTK